MTPRRFKALLNEQTIAARKVFDAVPQQEAWTVVQVQSELHRTNSSLRDRRTIEGCLASLVDTGLVKEPQRGVFVRVKVNESELADPTFSAGDDAEDVPQAMPEPQSPLDKLGELALQITQHANSLKTLAHKLETAALEIAEQHSKDLAQLEKLKQLAVLLKEVT